MPWRMPANGQGGAVDSVGGARRARRLPAVSPHDPRWIITRNQQQRDQALAHAGRLPLRSSGADALERPQVDQYVGQLDIVQIPARSTASRRSSSSGTV